MVVIKIKQIINMENIIDANDPKFLLGVMRSFEREISKTKRKNTSNVSLVRDLLMSGTSKGGRTSSYEMCEYIGVDGDAYTFYSKLK